MLKIKGCQAGPRLVYFAYFYLLNLPANILLSSKEAPLAAHTPHAFISVRTEIGWHC